MNRNRHTRSKFTSLNHGSGFQELVLAADRANKGIETEIEGKPFPRGPLDGAEACFRSASKRDAGFGIDGEKIFVVKSGEVEAEAVEIVGQKAGAADFRVDGVAVGIRKSKAKSERGELIDVRDEAPIAGQEGLHFETLLVAALRLAHA